MMPSVNDSRDVKVQAIAEVVGLDLEAANKLNDKVLNDAYVSLVIYPAQAEEDKKRREEELKARYCPAPHGHIWVCMYEIVQCYGGPEEGGWWYDAWTLEEARCVSYRKAKRTIAEMKKRAEDMSYGDIHSVRPGRRFVVRHTHIRAQYEDRVRPYYC